ncbi:MAG: hypothetical protein KAI64_06905, partial [Thermoplasmata archaeon]|nr:hypothetical protein [Thermoplasmata archaeon]
MKSKNSESKVEEKEAVCPLCGGMLNSVGECVVCGNKQSEGSAGTDKDSVIMNFAELGGVGESKAELLYASGYRNLDELQKASVNDVTKIDGISEKLAKNIRREVRKIIRKRKKSKVKDSKGMSQWLKGSDESFAGWLGNGAPADESKTKANKRPKRGADDKSTSALRRWLSGEEETLKTWLTEVDEEALPEDAKAHLVQDKELTEAVRKKDSEIETLRLELEELRKAMNRDLKNLKRDDFDPVKLIEETAGIKARLQTEVNNRKRLEEEIKQVKTGSIAMIKHMKAQQIKKQSKSIKMLEGRESTMRTKLMAELKAKDGLLTKYKSQFDEEMKKAPPAEKMLRTLEVKLAERESSIKAKEEELKGLEASLKNGEQVESQVGNEELRLKFQSELAEREKDFLKKENEFKNRIIELEKDVQKKDIEFRQQQESLELSGKSAPEVEKALAGKVKELQIKEKSIILREDEIKRLKDELRFKEDEIKKVREPMAYKEDELLRREEDMLYREKKIRAEMRKLEEAQSKMGGMEEVELKEKLETLKQEITRKEEEARNKEKYLKAKMEELRLREQGLIEEEIEQRDDERKLEITQEKVKTGTGRMDDLLLGGLPFGSNVAVYGPPFVGKEVIINSFMAEGVRKGVPTIWVITDKMPSDVREEMQYVISGYEEYEKLGLVKYIDSYSKSMGIEEMEEDPNTIYIEDPTNHVALLKAVDKVAKELKKDHDYYRIAFRSVSTLIAYLDPGTTYKFLQPFTGRRKRDKAVV